LALGETGLMQHLPETVAAIGKGIALMGGGKAGIDATKHHPLVWRQKIHGSVRSDKRDLHRLSQNPPAITTDYHCAEKQHTGCKQ
jgi:hypothetical protein